jgi:outer membrane protein assembly factor BamD
MTQQLKSLVLFFSLSLAGCTHVGKLPGTYKDPVDEYERRALKRLSEARSLHAVGSDWRAIVAYKSVLKFYPNSSYVPVALHELSRVYVGRRQYNSGFRRLKEIVQNHPQYEHFDQVIDEQFDIACLLMMGKRPRYLGLVPGFKDYDSSVDFFEGVVDRAPFTEKAPQALEYIAKLSYDHGSKTKAIGALDRLIENYAGSPLVPEAYLFKAKIYLSLSRGPQYDQESVEKAVQCYEDFLTLFDNFSGRSRVTPEQIARAKEGYQTAMAAWAESRLVLGDFFYLRRHYGKGALVFYNEALNMDPNVDGTYKTPSVTQRARDKMEKIQEGVSAPLNFVDHIFGPYRHLPLERREPAQEGS